ncbi:MAG: hypothetical protein ACP5JB_03990 [candidate division WOR-3 bacterium]
MEDTLTRLADRLNWLKNCLNNLSNTVLLTITLGIITYSIPFLWNAYQIILEKKKHTIGDKIRNILAKKYYSKALKDFTRCLQVPVGFFIFLGLFIIPLLPSLGLGWVGFIFLMLMFIYFSFLPKIFHKRIEEKSSTDLKNFLWSERASSQDLQKAFLELWQRDDQSIVKEFSIEPQEVWKFYEQKIDDIIEAPGWDIIRNYLENYSSYIDNRSIFLLVRQTLPKILQWHLIIWGKKQEDSIKREGNYRETENLINSENSVCGIFRRIEEKVLQSGDTVLSYMFFKEFKQHAEENKTESFKRDDNRIEYYIDSLMPAFYEVFFKVMEHCPNRYNIWWFDFPQEWMITKHNYKANIITQLTFDYFCNWAQQRIVEKPREEFDSYLDDVVRHLFPGIYHDYWAMILTFTMLPYGESRVKSVIETPTVSFGVWASPGGVGTVRPEFTEKELERIKQREQEAKREAFELAYLLFPEVFSEENLKKYINDLEKLKYNEESREEIKRKGFLNMFEEMQNINRTISDLSGGVCQSSSCRS